MTWEADALRTARNLDGGPRFYPAWQHPATYRYRWAIKALRDLPPVWRNTPTTEAAIAWYQERLVEFERGEFLAKERYLAVVRDRRERE